MEKVVHETFSKVRPEDLDLSDDEAVPAMPPPNGMSGLGGLGSMEMDDLEMEEDVISHMTVHMVGEEHDIPLWPAGAVRKRLLKAGVGYDNPIPPYEIRVRYTARVQGAAEPFDAIHAEEPVSFYLHLDGAGCPVPAGVCAALRTFLKGERSVVTLQPAPALDLEGSGRGDGNDARGPHACEVCEYDVELLDSCRVEMLCSGQILLKCVEDAKTWETFERRSNIFVAYELYACGQLACASDGKVGHPYVVGDEAANAAHGYPPFFDELLRSVTAQSKYEATLAAGAADGSVGVPAGAATRLTLQVLDVQPVEELDGEGGCRLLQTTLAPGDGWATPRAGWEVQVDFSLTAPDGALIRTTRGGEPLALTCGASTAAGLPRVFEHVVRMKRGQRACFRAAAEWAGEAAAAAAADGLFEFEIELLDWTEVCEIPKTHGELRAKVLQKGGSYDRPHAGARTRVRFSVALASAQPAGAGAPPPPLEASLDDGEVFVVDDETMLPAIDMAVRDMSPGARLELSVPPAWGYSQALADARGLAAAAVDAPLTVALELLSFEQATAEWDLVAAERLELQQRKKAQGNALFGQGRYARALDKYETSLSVVHDHEEDFDEASERPLVRTMRVQCLLNQATCQLKLGEPRRALDLAGKALSLDGASAKGVLRRGQAHLALGNLSEAKADLLKVAKLEPTNRDARDGLVAVQKAQAEHKLKEKALFVHMFDNKA